MYAIGVDPSTISHSISVIQSKDEEWRLVSTGLHPFPFFFKQEDKVFDSKRRHAGYEYETGPHIEHYGQLIDQYNPELIVYERFQNQQVNSQTEPVCMSIGILLTLAYEAGIPAIGLLNRQWKHYAGVISPPALKSTYNEGRKIIRERFKQELNLKSSDPECQRFQAMIPHSVDSTILALIGTGQRLGDATALIRNQLPQIARAVANNLINEHP